MTHAHDRSSLGTDYTREDRAPTGRKGMVSVNKTSGVSDVCNAYTNLRN